MDRRVVGYIAREAVRRYGAMEPDLPQKLRRNIRRNFGTTAPREEILALVLHYKSLYAFASRILPRYIRPSKGRYADPSDVRTADLTRAVRRRYPRESRAVLDLVIWYTVFYEYLK